MLVQHRLMATPAEYGYTKATSDTCTSSIQLG